MRISMLLALVLVVVGSSASAMDGHGHSVTVTNFPETQDVFVVNPPAAPPAVQDVNVVNPPPAPAACAQRFQLVGFTSATPSCGGGLFVLTLACQSEFGIDARMCTSVEVIDTITIPSGLVGEAMVRPVLQPTGGGPFDASMVTGGTDAGRFNCFGWRSPGSVTLVVDSTGTFRVGFETNDGPFSVACCAPVP